MSKLGTLADIFLNLIKNYLCEIIGECRFEFTKGYFILILVFDTVPVIPHKMLNIGFEFGRDDYLL
jgi:hypothetical protein